MLTCPCPPESHDTKNERSRELFDNNGYIPGIRKLLDEAESILATSEIASCAATPVQGELYAVKMVFHREPTGEHHAVVLPHLYPTEQRAWVICKTFSIDPAFGGFIESCLHDGLITVPEGNWVPATTVVVKLAAVES